MPLFAVAERRVLPSVHDASDDLISDLAGGEIDYCVQLI